MRIDPGDLVGNKYRIVRLIGDGGMGAVFEARHEVLGTVVALKFLHADLARRTGLASRFLQEAKVSASIQSPHVTRVTDVDTTIDGTPYMVMELLSGESLQQLLDRTRKLPMDRAIDFGLQILSGLEAAHALGVVHRDLKPDNVFVTPSAGGPLLKLLDFGIAKLRETSEYKKGLTRPGAIMGTPEYMAPEQLYAAERVDHRADIYSLGTMLYEMLTGERPAYGDDAPQIVAQVAAGNVKRIVEHDPSLPEGLAEVVHKAIQPDKSQRYEGALEMRLALVPFAGQLSHAGRLAATPVPAAAIQAMRRPDPTAADAPALPEGRAVPATLPPDDGVLARRPPHASPTVQAQAVPRTVGAAPAAGPPQAVGTPPTVASPPIAAPTVSAAPIPGAAYGPPPPADGLVKGATQEAPRGFAPAGASAIPRPAAAFTGFPQPPAARKPRRALAGIIALLLGVVVTAGVIVGIVYLRGDGGEEASSVRPLPPPSTTLTAAGEPPELPPPTTSPPPATATEKPRTPTKPGRDGGARSDAGTKDSGSGQASPFPFPPFPSSFPPIPSKFPPFPFPFPPPQSSARAM